MVLTAQQKQQQQQQQHRGAGGRMSMKRLSLAVAVPHLPETRSNSHYCCQYCEVSQVAVCIAAAAAVCLLAMLNTPARFETTHAQK
jgi:hypothetical protein